MVTHVSECIWTGLLHDGSGFYEFMEEVVTAKSFRRWSSLSSVVTVLSRGGTLASTRGGRLSKIGKTNFCACSLSGWLVNRIADRPSTCESAHVSRRLSVVESASPRISYHPAA